ncbi:MAG: dihydrofolate reductase family protein [Thermoleophilia bacterium]
MGRLIYSMMESLDGYVADAADKFDWAAPDESVHTFANQLQRPIGTNLLGRRMYQVMSAWETLGTHGDEPAYVEEFGKLWRASDKVVYSTTLGPARAARTRIERAFEPDAVRRMKDELVADISIGGPTLAAQRARPCRSPCHKEPDCLGAPTDLRLGVAPGPLSRPGSRAAGVVRRARAT